MNDFMNGYIVDCTDVEITSFNLLPKGTYNIKVVDAEVRDTKSGNGQYINVKFEVIDGNHEGNYIFDMFNIKNPNPVATRIGLANLKSLMIASGASEFKLMSVNELIGYKVTALVDVKNDEIYGERNIVKKYLPMVEDMSKKDTIPF